jgi:hypothetical protein
MPFVPTFSHRAFGEEDRMRVAAQAVLPWQESLGDTAATLFDGATASLNRWGNEQAFFANAPETPDLVRGLNYFNAVITGNNPFLDYYKSPKWITAEEAQQEYNFTDPFTNKPALSFTESVYPVVAQQMVERKKRELSRAWLTANSENTITSNVAHFGTSLAAGFLDPLQLAASMLPIGWFGKLGVLKNLAKTNPLMATIGAQSLQGAAGAALLEPIIYSRAYREQADYSLVDSGVNILFGGMMGATFPALEAGGRKVISLGISDPKAKARILEGGIYREANAFQAKLSDPTPLPITDKRAFLDTSTVEAVMKAVAAKEADGLSLSAQEHDAILNLDPGKIRADLEAGRTLTFDEYSASVANLTPEKWAESLPDSAKAFGSDRGNNITDAPFKGEFREGVLSIDKYGENPYVFESRMVDPRDYIESLKMEGMTYEQVVNLPTTQKYIEWFKSGEMPPPITAVFNEPLGKLYSTNRRRVVAAIEAGVEKIPALVEVGRRDEVFVAASAEKLGRAIPDSEVKSETARRLQQFQGKVSAGEYLPAFRTDAPISSPKFAEALDRGDIPAATSALKEEVAALEAEMLNMEGASPDASATEHLDSLQSALRELRRCATGS